jgi:hypothetical protein
MRAARDEVAVRAIELHQRDVDAVRARAGDQPEVELRADQAFFAFFGAAGAASA